MEVKYRPNLLKRVENTKFPLHGKFSLDSYSTRMEKQHTSDNKLYIILIIAILALMVGAAGLIISLRKPNTQSSLPTGGTSTVDRLPTSGDIQTMEIDPSTGHGVAESPKKN
jgi:hypothetical protein